MKSYYNELMSYNIVCSFVQGQLWKSQVSYFGNKIVFPIFIYFDDYETGNALGSHSGKNKLGAVYFSLPSIPQKLKSSLTNIYLFELFKSEDRKTFGNAAVFGKLISEIRVLKKKVLPLI